MSLAILFHFLCAEHVSDIKHSFSLQHGYRSNPTTPKLQYTSNQEQYDQYGNSTE